MFNLELAQKIIALLKQRQFKAPGLVVHKWRRIHDLESIPDGAMCLIFNRADDRTHIPKPEEVLMWLRDGKISPRSVFLATDSYDDFLSLCSGDTYQIVDLQDIDNCDDADGNECGFVVEVQGLKFDVIDMMAPESLKLVPEDKIVGTNPTVIVRDEVVVTAPLKKSTPRILFVDD